MVENWGTGKPDFFTSTITSRPQVITTMQIKWSQSIRYLVDAQGVAISTFYTVPAGYILEIGGGFISCKDSCINKLRVVADNQELVGDFRYDMQGHIAFSPSAGQTVEAGTKITVYIYNNDTLSSEYSLTLVGVLMAT